MPSIFTNRGKSGLGFILSMIIAAWAGSASAEEIWSSAGEVALTNVGALYTTTAGGSSHTITTTLYSLWTGNSTCTGAVSASGNGAGAFTFAPSSTYSANATGLYRGCVSFNSVLFCQSVKSVTLTPKIVTTNIFTSNPCFAVTYSSLGLGRLIYTGSAKSVTLTA